MDSQPNKQKNKNSDLSTSMISSSISSSISLDSQIKDNESNTQNQNTESTTNPTKSGRNTTEEEVESMECVGQKRKPSGKKLSHEERLQINRDTAKETRRRKKEELEELRRIIISNSRETQQFRRNNEMLLKENQLLKKQNLLLQEELAQSRRQSLLRESHIPQFNTLPAMPNSLLMSQAAEVLMGSSSNDRNSFSQRQNLLSEIALLQRATNGNVPSLNNDIARQNSLAESILQSDAFKRIANSQFQDISQQQQQSSRKTDSSQEGSY